MTRTATSEPTTKMLRKLAKDQEIDGWEEMDREELLDAVELPDDDEDEPARPAKKTTAKKSSAKKTAPRQRRAAEDDEDEDEAPSRTSKSASRPAKKSASKSAPPAKRTAAKKAAPARPAADDVEPAENGNPFREDTNLWFITEELIKGGKRSAMVKRLKKKIDLKPRQRAGDDYDVDAELDRRILIVGQILRRDHNFNVVRDGRGADATIVAEQP